MSVCPNCGEQNPARARFCMSCTAPLSLGPAAAGESRRTVTIVFCDVTGSTALAERLDPETVRRLMTRYFDEMREVLERHGGRVEKFIGDAVMAVFGVPILREDDAVRAVRAAVEMREALEELNDELERRWGVRVATRTGVNTGDVVVGGAPADPEIVVGDAVNVAARLEQNARPSEILIGERTYRLVRDAVVSESVEPLELKGKAERVPAWRLLDVVAGAPGLARRLDSPLVGRESELALLRGVFERTVEERTCHLFTVLGAAGVGKSRFASEFLKGLEGRAVTLTGHCLTYGEGITFWPIKEVVKQAAGIREDDTPEAARRKIDELVEGEEDSELISDRVRAVLGLSDAMAGIQETFWAVRRLFESMTRRQPLVVVFDDVHWAEPTFLDLVEYVAGWSKDVPILVTCLARPDLLDLHPTWSAVKPEASSISLDPLTDSETRQLTDNLLGRGRLADDARERITEAAEGNPLFVEEILRMLVDDGLLRREDGRWVPAGDLGRMAVPPSIHVLVAARLDRLTADERAVIQRASIIGKVFSWGAVAELSPESARPQVGSHLQTLVRKELIRPERATFPGDDAFRFGHIVTRDAAYLAVPKGVRADLHQRFAGWLQRVTGPRVAEYEEILGYHYEQAFRYRAELGPVGEAGRSVADEGARWLSSAGRRAFARGDMPAAVNLLSRAVALRNSDDPDRLQLLPDLAEALMEAGNLTKAGEVLDEAIRTARAAGNAGLESRAVVVRLLLEESTNPKERTDEALNQVERVIPIFEQLGDELGLAKAWRLVTDVHWTRSRYRAAEEAASLAIEHARRANDRREEAENLAVLAGSTYLGPTPVSQAVMRCEEILQGAEGSGVLEARTLRALAGLRAMEGHFDDARMLLRRSKTIFEDLGLKLRAAFASETGAVVEWLAGDADAAERELRSGYEIVERMGEQGYLATVAAMLGEAVYSQGRYDEAERLTRISEDTAAVDDMPSQVQWRSTRAKVLARRGRISEALDLAEGAVKLAEQTDDLNMHADALMDLAEALSLAGEPRSAALTAAKAGRLYEKKGNVVSAGRAAARVEQLTAGVQT